MCFVQSNILLGYVLKGDVSGIGALVEDFISCPATDVWGCFDMYVPRLVCSASFVVSVCRVIERP